MTIAEKHQLTDRYAPERRDNECEDCTPGELCWYCSEELTKATLVTCKAQCAKVSCDDCKMDDYCSHDNDIKLPASQNAYKVKREPGICAKTGCNEPRWGNPIWVTLRGGDYSVCLCRPHRLEAIQAENEYRLGL